MMQTYGDFPGQLQCFKEMIRIETERGGYAEAEQLLQSAFGIARKAGSFDDVVELSMARAAFYLSNSRPNDALKAYQKVAKLCQKHNAFRLQVQALIQIGDILKDMDRARMAYRFYQKALSMAEQFGQLAEKERLISRLQSMHMAPKES